MVIGQRWRTPEAFGRIGSDGVRRRLWVGLAVMGAKLGLELGWFDGSCVGGNLGFGVGLSVVGVNEGLSLGFLDVLVTGKATLVYFVSITSKAIFWSKHSSNGEIVPTFSFLVQGFHKIKCPFFKGHGTGLLVCILVPFSGVGPFGGDNLTIA